MAYSDALGGVVVLGGLLPPVPPMESVWSWNGARWQRLAASADRPAPQARTLSALACDTARHTLMMFGGTSSIHQSRYGDVWELSKDGWQDRSVPDGPGPQDHHACARDEARGEIVIYGGQDGERKWHRDTWLWNGRAWRRVEGPNPGDRVHHAMAYDSARRRVVLHGGFGREPGRTAPIPGNGTAVTGPAPDSRQPTISGASASNALRVNALDEDTCLTPGASCP